MAKIVNVVYVRPLYSLSLFLRDIFFAGKKCHRKRCLKPRTSLYIIKYLRCGCIKSITKNFCMYRCRRNLDVIFREKNAVILNLQNGRFAPF